MANPAGTITPSQISIKRKPLHQQQEVAAYTAPPISEITSTIEEMIADTNWRDEDQVNNLIGEGGSIPTIIGESHPDFLTFPQVSATSSPSVSSRVPSIIPELSVEGFGTPDPNVPASQLGGDLSISNIPLSPMGQQFQELGIPTKQLQIQLPEVDSAVTPASGLHTQEEIKDINQGNILGDDPFSEGAGGKPFALSGTDPKKIRQQVGGLDLLTDVFRGTAPPLGKGNVGDVARNVLEGRLERAATVGISNTVPAVQFIDRVVKSGNINVSSESLNSLLCLS